MHLNKEYILTLSSLKEIGIKGIGPKKIQAIGNAICSHNIKVNNLNDLHDIMQNMKENVFKKISIDELHEANKYALNLINISAKNGINCVGIYDDDFPMLLRSTIDETGKSNPPLFLWYKGDLSITKYPGIAIIGTREVTPEGIAGGMFLAEEFAKRGFNIISGLAIGCDTCGHKGALKVGGKTTAFLANGLDDESIYPAENKDLAEEIVNNGGLLLTEYPIGQKVNKYSLVARDRLQAGLSLATLVIQTGIKGGTMHAANTTLKAGKPLYAMKFKDEVTNQHEKCLGNAYLVEQGAKYIGGGDNLDTISEKIKNWKPLQTTLFD